MSVNDIFKLWRSKVRTQLIIFIKSNFDTLKVRSRQLIWILLSLYCVPFFEFKYCLNNVSIYIISLSIYNISYLSPASKYYLPINKYVLQSIKLFTSYLTCCFILCIVLSANNVKNFRFVWLTFYCAINSGVTLDWE